MEQNAENYSFYSRLLTAFLPYGIIKPKEESARQRGGGPKAG